MAPYWVSTVTHAVPVKNTPSGIEILNPKLSAMPPNPDLTPQLMAFMSSEFSLEFRV